MNASLKIGQKVRICASKETKGYPVMRGSVLMNEIGRIESIQSQTRGDGTAHVQATVKFPPVGRDVDRLFLVGVEYLEAME